MLAAGLVFFIFLIYDGVVEEVGGGVPLGVDFVLLQDFEISVKEGHVLPLQQSVSVPICLSPKKSLTCR